MRNISTFKGRILQYAEIKGFSKRKIYIDTGISNGVLDKETGLTEDNIAKFLNFYTEVNPEWLLTGEGSMLKNESKADVEVYEIPDTIIKAPLIGQYANGGYLRGYADPEYLEDQPAFYSTRKHSKGKYVAFEVRGESMNDESIRAISEGDVLLGMELKKEYWQPGVKLHIPKVFIIVHRTEGITVKEITEHDPDSGRILCHCWNKEPEYVDFELNLKDVVQLFYVKEISRNVKY